jgi:hypothetical protein
MAEVKVYIVGKDRKVGAMVKALAREIAGFQPVRGATKEFLAEHGYYLFDFAMPTEPRSSRRLSGSICLFHWRQSRNEPAPAFSLVTNKKLPFTDVLLLYRHYPVSALLGVKELGGACPHERRPAGADGFAIGAPREPFGLDVEKPQAVFA